MLLTRAPCMHTRARPPACPQPECSFNGGWRGKDLSKGRQYYVSSYFWDRAMDTGIITDPKAISWPTKPEVGAAAGTRV